MFFCVMAVASLVTAQTRPGLSPTTDITADHWSESHPQPSPRATESPLGLPLSSHLLVPKLGMSGFVVERGGLTVDDSITAWRLRSEVQGSPSAVNLASQAHNDLVWGNVLRWSGAGLVVVGGGLWGGGLAVDSSNHSSNFFNQNTSNQQNLGNALAVTGACVMVVGLVTEFVGELLSHAGQSHQLEAIDTFNGDLVDGKLSSYQAPSQWQVK